MDSSQISHDSNLEDQLDHGRSIEDPPPWSKPGMPEIPPRLHPQESIKSTTDEFDDGPIPQKSDSFGGYGSYGDWGMAKSDFPIDCIPGIAGQMAREIACVTTSRNKALAGVSVIATLSAAIGASLEICSGPNRMSRANLYFLVFTASGTGKSETFGLAVRPLKQIEADAMRDWQQKEEAGLRTERTILEGRIKKLTQKAADSSDEAKLDRLTQEIREAEEKLRILQRRLLSLPCMSVSDITKERLAQIMDAQPAEAVASMSSEARGILDIIQGRYKEGGDVDFYAAAYSGDSVSVDRVKNEHRIMLNRPCLTVFWLVQPDIMHEAINKVSLVESGFLPRCISFDAEAEPQELDDEIQPIPQEIIEEYHELITAIAHMRLSGSQREIAISNEARKVLRDYENECIRRRKSCGDLADFQSFVARWAENAWRLAVVFHAASHGARSHDHSMSMETALSAIGLMRWFTERQMDFLMASKLKKTRSRYERLMDLLRNAEGRLSVSLLNKNHGFAKNEVDTLVRLHSKELIIEREQNPNGGPVKTSVSLIPRRQNPQNPHNWSS